MTTRVLLAIGEMSGGGSQRQLLGILQHLDRSRFAPELYVISSQGELLAEVPEDVPVHCFERRHPQPVSRLPGAGFRARVNDFATVLRERGIDVIYDRTYHMTMITAAACEIRPTPRVSVIVADPKLAFENNPERFRWLKERLLRKAYRRAEVVAAVSEGVRKSSAEYFGLSADRLVTCYNFFDIAEYRHRAEQPLPVRVRKRPESFLILGAGRLHPQKGFDLLIEAVRRVVRERTRDPVELAILGTGELREPLSRQIQESKLENQVHLLGFHENPLPFYREADLFCLTSHYEGMPNALVEAMISGTPVLSTDCPSGPAEILQDGRVGELIPMNDPAALANAIVDALTHRERWKQRARAASAFIESEFALEAGIERTVRLLERVRETFRSGQ